ncbi:MAG: chorismate-binding protein, partial [Candidatus Altarchaeaceae archaeon]
KFETIFALPFSQIKEKNFHVIDEGAKILCMEIDDYKEISVDEILKKLPSENIELEDEIKYNLSDNEYENIIQKVIDEIRNGEGANFVISRKAYGKIKDMNVNKALTIFKNLLNNEIGSHWTFIFYTGKNFLIGASPETHISLRNGRVKMHPISGTFRKEYKELKKLREKFIEFLNNEKEINELFMVVDEELKIMGKLCKTGMIVGPILKEMSALIHTEYLLSGKSDENIIDIIKESMFAATVTGSPLENACRIIKKYEREDRRYYSGALVLIGKENNRDFVDSCILIRTVEIDNKGNFSLRAGPTIVRDSIPSEEVKETKSKMEALINSFKKSKKKKYKKILQYFDEDPEILETLQNRNQKLSKFWFFSQEGEDNTFEEILNKKILIIDNEDGFCYMLKHMLSSMGAKVEIDRYENYRNREFKNFENFDIVAIGPGPGNPLDLENEKMKIIDEIIENLMNSGKKFFAICLGHQILCKKLGFKILRKKIPLQGT